MTWIEDNRTCSDFFQPGSKSACHLRVTGVSVAQVTKLERGHLRVPKGYLRAPKGHSGYDGFAYHLRVTCVSLFYHFGKNVAHYGSLVIGGKIHSW